MMYIMQQISVADARQNLAEILGQVAYGGEAFVITKKGRPMARLVPVLPADIPAKPKGSLADVKGWLEDDDPFFKELDRIRAESRRQKPTNPFEFEKPAKKRRP
jgi:prevent-host-death family protein